jgi:hypothetical protein
MGREAEESAFRIRAWLQPCRKAYEVSGALALCQQKQKAQPHWLRLPNFTLTSRISKRDKLNAIVFALYSI